MKLLLVTSLQENRSEIISIMERAEIDVFSLSETTGFKNHHAPPLLDNWFSHGREHADSIFVFSFTEEANALTALDLIRLFNKESKTDFPIRAFILPVEKSTYDTALRKDKTN